MRREATNPHHRQAQSVDEHQAHLQQDLQTIGNHLWRAIVENLGTIAALQQETFAFLRFRELLTKVHHLARSDQRWQRVEFAKHAFQLLCVAV